MRSNGTLMIGISIIFFGVIFILEARPPIIGGFIQYWPALLIILGAVSWVSHGVKPSTWNLIVILAGVALLSGAMFRWAPTELIWPSLLILIGIKLVIGPKVRGKLLR